MLSSWIYDLTALALMMRTEVDHQAEANRQPNGVTAKAKPARGYPYGGEPIFSVERCHSPSLARLNGSLFVVVLYIIFGGIVVVVSVVVVARCECFWLRQTSLNHILNSPAREDSVQQFRRKDERSIHEPDNFNALKIAHFNFYNACKHSYDNRDESR